MPADPPPQWPATTSDGPVVAAPIVPTEPCEFCEGVGWTFARELTCLMCGGTGRRRRR